MSRRGRAGGVAERQARNLDRVLERHIQQQVERDAVRLVLEPAVARPVTSAVERAKVVNRRRRRAPQITGLVVPHVDRFPGRSVTGSFDHGVSWFSRLFRDHVYPLPSAATWNPNVGLAMTLIHGAGVACSGPSRVTYSLPSAANPPRPLKNSRSCGAGPTAVLPVCVRRDDDRRFRTDGDLACSVELIGEAPVLARQHDPGDRREHGARRRRDQVRAQDEYRSPRGVCRDRRARLAHPMQGLEGVLQVLHVRRPPVVQDHEVDGELLHAPVLMGLQQLPRDGDVVDTVDSQQHDRQIAGDALAPEG